MACRQDGGILSGVRLVWSCVRLIRSGVRLILRRGRLM